MRGVAWLVVLMFALTAASGASANASEGGHAVPAKAKKKKKKKKCKKGRVFSKGKCREVKIPAVGTPQPNSVVRASLSWDGPALFDLQIADAQGRRAGHYPGEGVLNEIPNASYSGGAGGPGPETDTFTDDLFYGGPGSIYYPSPGNRGFAVTICDHAYGGSAPVHVSFTQVEANGLVDQSQWTITGSSGPVPTGCVTY
jgi:hypothetical protein